MNDSVFLQHHVCPISGEQNQSTLTFNFVFVNYTGNSETSSAERNWPDDREQDGSTADQVHEEEDLLPQVVFTGAFLRGLDDDVGYISKNLQATGDRYMSADCSKPHITDLSHAHTHTLTCRGMTIMKIFFSLSDRMYLTKAQPVPMSARVMKSRAPFSLETTTTHTLIYLKKKR